MATPENGEAHRGHLLEGYDTELFEEEPDSALICAVCQQVMRDPQLVVKCGHHFCKSCLEALLQGRNPMCALDRQPLSNEPGQIVDDRSVWRKISCLRTKCSRNTLGCQWKGTVKEFDDHVKSRRCQVQCEHGCGARVMFFQMEDHTQKDCPKAKVPCPFKRIGRGCPAEVERSALPTHLQNSILEHQLLQRESIDKLLDNIWRASSTPSHERRTVFYWLFHGFNKCLVDKARMYSDPFYTGPCHTGYCLQIRVETGDSPDGISVYYCVARGKNDDRVSWPFRRNVRLQILNSRDDSVVTSALTTPPTGDEAIRAIIAKPTQKRNSRGRGKRSMLPFSKLEEAGVKDTDCLRVRAIVPWTADDGNEEEADRS